MPILEAVLWSVCYDDDTGVVIITYLAIVKNQQQRLAFKQQLILISRGVDPYGTGGTRPPQYLDWGDIITNVTLNISKSNIIYFLSMQYFLHKFLW